MLSKGKIINVLYVSSFPFFGIGQYISAIISPSLGFIFSAFPPLLILIFYVIDKLYQGKIRIGINGNYFWVLAFLASSMASVASSFTRGLPDLSLAVVVGMGFLLFVPFHAFMVCHLYNAETDKNRLPDLTFIGLNILLAINLIGYFGLGLTNQTHNIEGRVNFPFLGGLYEGSNLLAILSLIIYQYISQRKYGLIKRFFLLLGLTINFTLIFFINSRLCIMLLMLVLLLFTTRLIKGVKIIYMVSWFTLPILLSSGLLIYKLLQLPVFTSIMQRVDIVDVTTFNGRAFLWENALDWLIFDRRGLFFGNGYRGHYFIDLISDVAQLWNQEDLHVMHLHSTILEILVSQGVISLMIFMSLCYKAYMFYRRSYSHKTQDGIFFIVMVFFIFLIHVDSFANLNTLGFFLWSVLISGIVVRKKADVHLKSQTN